jgi:hypothetical protein
VTTEEALVIHSKIFSCETNNQLIARKESGI